MKAGLKILRIFAIAACVQAVLTLPAQAVPLAYDIVSYSSGGIPPLGLDLYGVGRTVPEPATLMILGFALLLISVAGSVTRRHALRRL